MPSDDEVLRLYGFRIAERPDGAPHRWTHKAGGTKKFTYEEALTFVLHAVKTRIAERQGHNLKGAQ